MAKKPSMKDCIKEEMDNFRPVGETAKERTEFVLGAFKKAAEDCKKKLGLD